MESFFEERNDKGSRRQFLKNFSAVSAAMAIGTAGISGCSAPAAGKLKNARVYDNFSDRSPVCLVKGTDRKKMIYDSLKPFESHLKEKIGTKQVLIKINCNRPGDQLIKTHPDAVRGVIEMVSSMTSRQILVGESTSGEQSTEETYSPFRLLPSLKKNITPKWSNSTIGLLHSLLSLTGICFPKRLGY